MSTVIGPNIFRRERECMDPNEAKKIMNSEMQVMRIALRDLLVSDEENELFDNAEIEVIAEYGINVGEFYSQLLNK
jgi:hypothetical protein